MVISYSKSKYLSLFYKNVVSLDEEIQKLQFGDTAHMQDVKHFYESITFTKTDDDNVYISNSFLTENAPVNCYTIINGTRKMKRS
ncbi:hypothetical protein SKUN_00118 [Spiroplasma kunkelii CR2-3x]|uniref:Uncharacterized protein n=1 Tax=Spiroplasma kunkelii CR2-3x TaxID=273035 RepID=A0A0K2JF43_SPIKU|nr:hypothetical protein [Spiroplasma kunkelii]ALA97042.1 hypothetical protein SKUN_00118 [Spiroplasma kunkelii CR2-3x]